MKAKVFLSLADPGLAAMILQGGVGVIPTDTVYGLVAKATHKAAVDSNLDTYSQGRLSALTAKIFVN